MHTRFRKIGVNAQTTVKEFSTAKDAETARDKSVAEKLYSGRMFAKAQNRRDDSDAFTKCQTTTNQI